MKIQFETIETIVRSLENILTLMNVSTVPDLQKLANFVKKCLSNFTLEEIEKAFEMTFIGTLNVELTQTGGLNAQKIGKVMAAFRNYKHQQNKALYSESEKPEPPPEELKRLERVFENDMCTEFEKYKNTGRHDFLLRVVAYDHLEKKGIIEKDNYLQFKGKVYDSSDKNQRFINSTVFVSTKSAEMKRFAFNNFFKQLAIDGKSLRDIFIENDCVKT